MFPRPSQRVLLNSASSEEATLLVSKIPHSNVSSSMFRYLLLNFFLSPCNTRFWWTLTRVFIIGLDIFFTWTNAADDEKIYSILNMIISRIDQAATARGVNIPYLFMNDAGSEQAVLQSFGADNVRRLKSIAAKYDPKEVFQRLQNDGFLLRRVLWTWVIEPEVWTDDEEKKLRDGKIVLIFLLCLCWSVPDVPISTTWVALHRLSQLHTWC